MHFYRMFQKNLVVWKRGLDKEFEDGGEIVSEELSSVETPFCTNFVILQI